MIPFVLPSVSSKDLNSATFPYTFKSSLLYCIVHYLNWPESDFTVPITSLCLGGIIDGMQADEIYRDFLTCRQCCYILYWFLRKNLSVRKKKE